MTGRSAVALAVTGLTKIYPGTVALQDFDFTLYEGEVRALLGKNGAGKSTFVEILSGTKYYDAGEIRIAGRKVELGSPVQARSEGIATVHQDLSLFPDLSVRENITIGRCARRGVISRKTQELQAKSALQQMGVEIDLNERVGALSARDQQLTAIAKALSYHPRVLILDEPTSALSSEEVEHLITLVRRLAEQGVSVIYVSHRLDEIPRVAHSVTVLRDGMLVDTVEMTETSPSHIVEMMLGGILANVDKHTANYRPSISLTVAHLRNRKLHDVSFELREGEVLGLWGAPGAGRTELLRAIYGLDSTEGGEIRVRQQSLRKVEPSESIRIGVGFSPDDRKRDGLLQLLSVAENITLACFGRVSRAGVISVDEMLKVAGEQVSQLGIKVSGLNAPVNSLSGGNQQKVVLGKWLATQVKLLLLDEPTKGIDVEAKAGLYALLRKLTAEGVSVLLAATELEEIFLVCDRVLVLRRGVIVADTPIDGTTPQKIMQLALSGEDDE